MGEFFYQAWYRLPPRVRVGTASYFTLACIMVAALMLSRPHYDGYTLYAGERYPEDEQVVQCMELGNTVVTLERDLRSENQPWKPLSVRNNRADDISSPPRTADSQSAAMAGEALETTDLISWRVYDPALVACQLRVLITTDFQSGYFDLVPIGAPMGYYAPPEDWRIKRVELLVYDPVQPSGLGMLLG